MFRQNVSDVMLCVAGHSGVVTIAARVAVIFSFFHCCNDNDCRRIEAAMMDSFAFREGASARLLEISFERWLTLA